MSKVEVNEIDKQSGSTLTLGGSGTAVTLACGATQSGFGRSGSVNWQTSIKTANFTAVSGEGYFCDTATTGAFTLTLPSSPAVGDIVALKDYASNFSTANLTIGRNGSNLNGNAANFVADTDNLSLTLVYADATKGWLSVEEGTGFIGENFISATGGTIINCGDFRIHKFTGPGDFLVSGVADSAPNNSVDYVVIAGGGGGGNGKAGGGGAGGYRESPGTATCYTASPLGASPAAAITVTAQSYPIVVGAGGSGSPAPNTPGNAPKGSQGSTSSGLGIASAGGGGGGSVDPSHKNGDAGGSGGGGSQYGGAGTGGTGNSPPVNPAQGTNGGSGYEPGAGGGGGGAVDAGSNATNSPPQAIAGDGGDGTGTEIIAQPNPAAPGIGTPGPNAAKRFFSGGGGGGMASCSPAPDPTGLGTGGYGGGGCGQNTDLPRPSDATGGTNTGGGGGGSSGPSSGPHSIAGGSGGSGVVIIRYKYK